MLEIVVPLIFILSVIVLVIMGIGSTEDPHKKKDGHGDSNSSNFFEDSKSLDYGKALYVVLEPLDKLTEDTRHELGHGIRHKLEHARDHWIDSRKENKSVREMPRIPGPALGKELHHDRIAHDIFEIYNESKAQSLTDNEKRRYVSTINRAIGNLGSSVPASLRSTLDLIQNSSSQVNKEEVYRVLTGESEYSPGSGITQNPSFTTARLAYGDTTARDDIKIFGGMELPTKERGDMSPVGAPEKLRPKVTPPFIEKGNTPVGAHYSLLNDKNQVYLAMAGNLAEDMVQSLRTKYEAQKANHNAHHISNELFHYIEHGEEHAHDIPSKEKLRDQRIYSAIGATMRQYASHDHIHENAHHEHVVIDTSMAGAIATYVDLVLRQENNGVGIGTKKKGGH